MSVFAELREERRALLSLLADGEHWIELRYPDARGDWRKRWGATPEQADAIAARFQQRFDVYVGVLPRLGRDGEDQRRYAPSRVVWAECDLARASRKALMFEPTPTAIVLSGGVDGDELKRHVYWALDEPLLSEDVRRHTLRLAHYLEADEASCDEARVLRVPGSTNHKTAQVARLESFTGETHALADITGWLEDSPRYVPEGERRPARPMSHWAQIVTRTYVTGCGETHPDVLSLAGWLMEKLRSREVVLELLLPWSREHHKPPKPAREIEAILAYIENRQASKEHDIDALTDRIRISREEGK